MILSTTLLSSIRTVPKSGQEKRIFFLPWPTTWRQKFPADQRSIFVLNLHVHNVSVNHMLLYPYWAWPWVLTFPSNFQ